MALLKVGDKVEFRVTATLTVQNPELSMSAAEADLIRAGNRILSRNEAERSFVVAQVSHTYVVGEDLDDEKPLERWPCNGCAMQVRYPAGIAADVEDRKAAMDAIEAKLRANGDVILKRIDEAELFMLLHSTGKKDGAACPGCAGQGIVVKGA